MVLALIVGAAIMTAPAMAARERRGGYGSGPGALMDVTAVPGLELTAEQKERIGVLREAHLRDLKPLLDLIFIKGRELRGLWLAKNPDRERIMALQKEVHDLRGQLLGKFTAYRLEVHQMLTPDQQEKIRAFDAERSMRRMGSASMPGGTHHGPGEGMPPPGRGGPAGEKRPGDPLKAGGKGVQSPIAP